MTSYNTGTYYEDEKWLEFDQMYDPLYLKNIFSDTKTYDTNFFSQCQAETKGSLVRETTA